ncbi:Transcription initiation factor TFIID, subunit BDF1 [Handroanthus impetiginosus]|uniref:Transcription initiation factor TFIID, subunit BDF1 n=1 Tax=Handroanthus impetiginosus TaxID=429701 RepID=A0A2G9GM82_9LAMI|nr:Transcription initiation factor TFIID, subunit BDF1 [Handroanthus impetiginosus]
MLGGENEGSKEEDKLGERKVYRRRSVKGLENSKSSNNLLREQQQQLKGQAVASEGLNSTKRLHNCGFDAGSDNFSGLRGVFLRQENKVRISLSMKSKREALELRRKLEDERDMVRSLMRKIEANESEKNANSRDEDKVTGGVGPPRMSKPLNQLSVLVYENSKPGVDNAEKEKRTPKANKLYRNSEFLLAKDKIPPSESNKKLKSNGKKGGGSGMGKEKFPNQVFKSCNALIERLMKHKHAWVFNKPVDAVALGLHDYFDIIKNPMDLGTVKDRLTQNWYKTPMEFAEDVRLTFQNAMTYNPKGQDVYAMAEQLSKIFEEKWVPIEADYTRELKLAADLDVGSPTPTSRKAPSQSRARPDMKKTIDKSESTSYAIDPKRKTMNIAQSGKVPIPKKPKAKDPNKREMTYDEKQKLSVNLQSLPSEKLEKVVQIIKKRNPSVSHQDDEIEVDIDSVDTETLWELDRFITNYKKNLSKNKRKAEIVTQLTTSVEQNTKEKITPSVVSETPKGSRTEEEKVVSAPVQVEEPGRNDTNQGDNRSSSTSDSGSSSSDSDGESSSVDGSDGGNSPKN